MRYGLLIALGVLLVSCSTQTQLSAPSSPVPTFVAPAVSPYQVVKEMFSALNDKDINGAMSFFADDAIYIVPRGPDKGVYLGKDQIQKLLEPDVENDIISEISDFKGGSNIIILLHRRIQKAEAISAEIQTFSVVDGKITGMGVDPASLIRFAFGSLNDGKPDQAIRLFASDAVCLFASGQALDGRDSIQAAFQRYVDSGSLFEVSILDVQGYYGVTWTVHIYDRSGKITDKITRHSEIEDGKIEDCMLLK